MWATRLLDSSNAAPSPPTPPISVARTCSLTAALPHESVLVLVRFAFSTAQFCSDSSADLLVSLFPPFHHRGIYVLTGLCTFFKKHGSQGLC